MVSEPADHQFSLVTLTVTHCFMNLCECVNDRDRFTERKKNGKYKDKEMVIKIY